MPGSDRKLMFGITSGDVEVHGLGWQIENFDAPYSDNGPVRRIRYSHGPMNKIQMSTKAPQIMTK